MSFVLQCTPDFRVSPVWSLCLRKLKVQTEELVNRDPTIRAMQTCSLRGGGRVGVTVMQCTWDSTQWKERHVWHRRSWSSMLERRSRGQRSRQSGGTGGGIRKVGVERRWSGGQSMTEGRLSVIEDRHGLCVWWEEARLSRGAQVYRRKRDTGGRRGGALYPGSSWVLVDLRVGWGSHRKQQKRLENRVLNKRRHLVETDKRLQMNMHFTEQWT